MKGLDHRVLQHLGHEMLHITKVNARKQGIAEMLHKQGYLLGNIRPIVVRIDFGE